MPGYSPIQEAFNAGEVSRRFSAQTSSPLYRRALAHCRNFIPTPQGSLLRRAGTQDRGVFSGALRVIPFAVAGEEPVSIVLYNNALRIVDSSGNTVAVKHCYTKNPGFHSALSSPGGTAVDASARSWRFYEGATTEGVNDWWKSGYCSINRNAEVYDMGPGGLGIREGPYQVFAAQPGAYTLRIRVRNPITTISQLEIFAGPVGAPTLDVMVTPTAVWQNLEYPINVVGAADVVVGVVAEYAAGRIIDVDDFVVTRDDEAASATVATPWSAAAVPFVQYDQDNAKNVMVLTHPDGVRLVWKTSHGLWVVEEAPWINKPVEWTSGNYPAVIEHGYQGRLWLGGSPDQPNSFRASKSGSPFDFTVGNLDADSMAWIASLRGAIRWMRGHLTLLIGAEQSEQSANGNGGVITPGNPPEIRDESVFGSARKQIAVAGDEVLFVPRDSNGVRALSFDALGKNGWVSNPVSYLAHHLTKNVKELHFAYSPEPTLVVVRTNDTMVACTYKKDQQGLITAWFRTNLLALSVAVLETTAGSVLRMLIVRADGTHVEDLPLHESSIDYLDSWSTVVADGNGRLTGLARFEGSNIRVKQDGVSIGTFAVVGGIADLGAEYAGVTVVVGLTYLARAVTLPLEGGDPTGSSQGKAVHWSEVAVRLNESARPMLNGERAGLGKPFGPSLDTLETLLTADVRAGTLEVSEGGVVTIEQEEPYRTEICGLFGQAEVSRV